LAISFSTMLFEPMYEIPRYRDWYRGSDQTSAYRYLRRMLQVLQWQRGPKRWVLKSPQHLEQIRPLLAVFPDAKIIQTHRDPVRITASFCTMAAYSLRMQNESIDPHRVGRYWADRVEDLLRSAVEHRPLLPKTQVMDVHFQPFMADQWATVERVLELAEHPFTREAGTAMERYLANHERGRLGTIDYRLEDFGLDPAERRGALRFYQEYFEVPDETEQEP
jgi:Sulfotransferase family